MSDRSTSTIPSLDELLSLEDFPPFPSIASEIIAESNREDSSVNKIISLIECDPAIGVKVLELANSPLYGASRPISTVAHAVVLLGVQAVSKLAIAISASSVFSAGQEKYSKHRADTFRFSIACATSARLISRALQLGEPDEAFICGIVQDVGKLVFLHKIPEQYEQVIQQRLIGDTTSVEQDLIGFDHSEIGSKCGRQWRLPQGINFAIQHHHLQFDAEQSSHSHSNALIVANYLVEKWRIGISETLPELPQNDSIEERLSSVDLDELQKECTDQFQAVMEICAT